MYIIKKRAQKRHKKGALCGQRAQKRRKKGTDWPQPAAKNKMTKGVSRCCFPGGFWQPDATCGYTGPQRSRYKTAEKTKKYAVCGGRFYPCRRASLDALPSDATSRSTPC